MTANGTGFTAAQFLYYYTAVFYNYYQQSYYYDYYYGEGYGAALTGFDYTKSPEEQLVPTEDGEELTFADHFAQAAVGSLEQIAYFVAQARALGLTLDEEDEQKVRENLDSAKQTAAQYGMTVDELLEQQYGAGINGYILESVMREQMLAEKYETYVKEQAEASVTEEQIAAAYDEDPLAYQTIDARVMRFDITYNEDYTTDAEAQQAAAQAFLDAVTDEASFGALAVETAPDNFPSEDYTLMSGGEFATLQQYMGDDAANWAFDEARKAGDKAAFATTQAVYALYIVSPASRNEERLPSVRHLLVKFDETASQPEEDATAPADEGARSKEDALALAEKYLKEYNKGDKTEESFAALADEYSDDTASTSAGGQGVEGGLYADMTRGQFVEPFENWAFDEARQPGDVEIIETQFGYHLMYFVGLAEMPGWMTAIRDKLASDAAEEALQTAYDAAKGSASFDQADLAALQRTALDAIAAMMG